MGLAVFLPTEPVTFLIEAFLVIFIIYLFMLNKYGKGDEKMREIVWMEPSGYLLCLEFVFFVFVYGLFRGK